jgi:ankyrin repeat protein
MKNKDYIKAKLIDDIEKLTTAKSVCIKRANDHSVVCERINIGLNITNGQFSVHIQPSGQINVSTSDFQYGALINAGSSTGGLICIDNSGNVHTASSTVYSQLIGSGIARSDMTDETSNFIDQSFNEVEALFNSINEINATKTNTNWYLTKNGQVQTEIAEIQQKINKNNVTSTELTKQANSFKIADIVTPYDVNQKSHILQKIWLQSDIDSLNLKESIKQQGFNPHYVNKAGEGLIHLSIIQNDHDLFQLLIDNQLDFNFVHNEKSLFDLVLSTKNHQFIQTMFSSGNIEKFTLAVLVKTLTDEANDLSELFKIKPEFSSIKYKGASLLQLAIKAKKYQAAEEIIKVNNITLSQLNEEGLSALELALIANNAKGVELLQKYNADTLTDNQGDTLIHRAIAKGSIGAIKMLLNNKPTLIDCQNSKNGQSVLHTASYFNQVESFKMLLELKPELINTIDNYGYSVLHWASYFGYQEIAGLLLNRMGVELVVKTLTKAYETQQFKVFDLIEYVNAELIYDTMRLMSSSTPQVVQQMLSHPAIEQRGLINIADEQGNTPLYKASILDQNSSLTDLLLEYGADIKQTVKACAEHNNVSIAEKIIGFKEGVLQCSVVKQLLQENEGVLLRNLIEQQPQLLTFIDNEGNSLLHLSCRYGQKSVTEYLLLHDNSLVKKQNNLEQTALHVLLQNATLTEEAKLEFAELILACHPNILLADSEHHSINDLVIESHPMILAKCYEYELIGGVEGINENL